MLRRQTSAEAFTSATRFSCFVLVRRDSRKFTADCRHVFSRRLQPLVPRSDRALGADDLLVGNLDPLVRGRRDPVSHEVALPSCPAPLPVDLRNFAERDLRGGGRVARRWTATGGSGSVRRGARVQEPSRIRNSPPRGVYSAIKARICSILARSLRTIVDSMRKKRNAERGGYGEGTSRALRGRVAPPSPGACLCSGAEVVRRATWRRSTGF